MKIKIPEILKITNPRWIKKISMRRSWKGVKTKCTIDGKEIDLGMYGTCIVGEALNLQGNYSSDDGSKLEYHKYCQTCLNYSDILYGKVNSLEYVDSIENKTYFEDSLESFAMHLKEDHPNYIANAKARARKEGK